jgi:hypothetical protein
MRTNTYGLVSPTTLSYNWDRPSMLATTQYLYITCGLFAGLLLLHWAWCQFVAYPIAFEKNLKRGKSWVYIPLQWKGSYKFQIVFLSRIIMLSLVAVGVVLLAHYTHRQQTYWLFAYGLGAGFVILRLNAFWLDLRYQQQEDAYYFLHDELRIKLEGEGKDMADAAFKNLAGYQHQNLLRKADEQGQLIKTLKAQAKKSRKHRKEVRAHHPVEG